LQFAVVGPEVEKSLLGEFVAGSQNGEGVGSVGRGTSIVG